MESDITINGRPIVVFSDREMRCCSCQQRFTWTVAEQRYYHDHEFIDPKRCPSCRKDKRRRYAWKESHKTGSGAY